MSSSNDLFNPSTSTEAPEPIVHAMDLHHPRPENLTDLEVEWSHITRHARGVMSGLSILMTNMLAKGFILNHSRDNRESVNFCCADLRKLLIPHYPLSVYLCNECKWAHRRSLDKMNLFNGYCVPVARADIRLIECALKMGRSSIPLAMRSLFTCYHENEQNKSYSYFMSKCTNNRSLGLYHPMYCLQYVSKNQYIEQYMRPKVFSSIYLSGIKRVIYPSSVSACRSNHVSIGEEFYSDSHYVDQLEIISAMMSDSD